MIHAERNPSEIIISYQLIAPSGCLQYWMDSSGWVSSFNYASGASGVVNSIGVQGSRQIASTSYGACVKAAAGMCSITWSLVSFQIFAFHGILINFTLNSHQTFIHLR